MQNFSTNLKIGKKYFKARGFLLNCCIRIKNCLCCIIFYNFTADFEIQLKAELLKRVAVHAFLLRFLFIMPIYGNIHKLYTCFCFEAMEDLICCVHVLLCLYIIECLHMLITQGCILNPLLYHFSTFHSVNE